MIMDTRSSQTHPPVFYLTRLILAGLILAISTACSFSLLEWPFPAVPTSTPGAVLPTATPFPAAQVTFEVVLPAPLLPGETLAISLLDEVTGLSFNTVNYLMQPKDAQTYFVNLPIAVGSVAKYRYILAGSAPAIEATSFGMPVRYRMYYVTGPGAIRDIISAWTTRPFAGNIGQVQGRVLNADTGTPLPNILVTGGGAQAWTDSAGRFDLWGLPPGTHNITAYAPDGTYTTFQQGAQVAAGLVTPVELRMKPAPLVNVTFIVNVPANTVKGAPVRLAGNLLQLGNTFADLNGGLSTTASRMPTLTRQADGRYSISLYLPAGVDLRYKYTLGDGFWNAEHKTSGEFVIRQLIIPQTESLQVSDTVETWQAGNSAPILFQVKVPPVTPPGDVIYIQFNPYGWTEPIPMWPLGNNQWAYKVYSPLNMLGDFTYRYCRNAECGSADDQVTPGANPAGRRVSTSLVPQDIQDTIAAWNWLKDSGPVTITSSPIQKRAAGFVAGVELQPMQHPTWSTYMPQAFQNIQALGTNWVFLTLSWSYLHNRPLIFTIQGGKDPFWNDSLLMVNQARALNLNVAIFPQPRFPVASANWWIDAPRSPDWWNAWFDSYRRFALNHADLAAQSGAQALILGGEWLAPAMPQGTLADGSASGVPDDAENRWRSILAEVRSHYKGAVWWAWPYTPGNLTSVPGFVLETDGFYLLWQAPLATATETPRDQIFAEAGRLLDQEVAVFQGTYKKPIVLGLAFPSVTAAGTACLPDTQGRCLEWTVLSRPNPDFPSLTLSLQRQADLYQAMLEAVNGRSWVGGIVSRGYYPPALLQDKSASVHGKPAADILWYWFPRLLGITR
jgi:hypothetical protein